MVPEHYSKGGGMSRLVVLAQSVYLGLTGIWPLISLRGFEAVTGPKTDDFLVYTVALLTVAISIALAVGAVRRVPAVETITLGIGAAVAFGAIDVVFAPQRLVRSIYLVDAFIQAAFVVLLVTAAVRRYRARSSVSDQRRAGTFSREATSR